MYQDESISPSLRCLYLYFADDSCKDGLPSDHVFLIQHQRACFTPLLPPVYSGLDRDPRVLPGHLRDLDPAEGVLDLGPIVANQSLEEVEVVEVTATLVVRLLPEVTCLGKWTLHGAQVCLFSGDIQ